MPLTGAPPSTLTCTVTGLVFESGSIAQPVARTFVGEALAVARPSDSYLPNGSKASETLLQRCGELPEPNRALTATAHTVCLPSPSGTVALKWWPTCEVPLPAAVTVASLVPSP